MYSPKRLLLILIGRWRYVLTLAKVIKAELFPRISSKIPLRVNKGFFVCFQPFKKSFFGLQLGIETWSFTSSILGLGSDYIEEPGRLQTMGSQRVGHGWVTSHRNGRNEVDPNRQSCHLTDGHHPTLNCRTPFRYSVEYLQTKVLYPVSYPSINIRHVQ